MYSQFMMHGQKNIEFSVQIFENYQNIKFHENFSRGSRVVPCGQTDGQTDMTKLTVDFRNFVITPKYSSRSNRVIIWLRTSVSVSDSAAIIRVLAVSRWHRPMSHRHFRLCALVLQ